MAIRFEDVKAAPRAKPKQEPEPYKLALPQSRRTADDQPKETTMTKTAPKGSKTAEPKPKRTFANMPRYRVSAELGTIMGGHGHVTRAEVMAGLWVYIKANGLQDATVKTTINPDTILAGVTGGEPFGQMKLAGMIGKHLSKDETGGPLDAGTA